MLIVSETDSLFQNHVCLFNLRFNVCNIVYFFQTYIRFSQRGRNGCTCTCPFICFYSRYSVMLKSVVTIVTMSDITMPSRMLICAWNFLFDQVSIVSYSLVEPLSAVFGMVALSQRLSWIVSKTKHDTEDISAINHLFSMFLFQLSSLSVLFAPLLLPVPE